MSGYVASARIVRGTPRIAHGDRCVAGVHELALPAAASAANAATAATAAIVESAPPAPERGAGRWAAIRDRWSQLTFYLFDTNSWR